MLSFLDGYATLNLILRVILAHIGRYASEMSNSGPGAANCQKATVNCTFSLSR